MLPDSGENFHREIAEPFLQVGEPLIQHRHQILGFKGVIPGHDGKMIFTDQNPDSQAFAQLLSLPLAPGSRDDVVFAGLNGVSFYFMRGTVCEMPAAVVEILKNCGEM